MCYIVYDKSSCHVLFSVKFYCYRHFTPEMRMRPRRKRNLDATDDSKVGQIKHSCTDSKVTLFCNFPSTLSTLLDSCLL